MRLAPTESVQVRSKVSGYLATTSFVEGEIVQAGDILAVIDQRPSLAEVGRSEANPLGARALQVQADAAVV